MRTPHKHIHLFITNYFPTFLRKEREERNSNAKPELCGENILYFGCQSKNKDYIYKDELESFQNSKLLSKLYLAFSREQKEKVYVQHLLKREPNSSDLIDYIDSGAYIYVCGATNMGTDVHETFLSILQSKKNISRQKAETILENLQKSGRYVQELWTA